MEDIHVHVYYLTQLTVKITTHTRLNLSLRAAYNMALLCSSLGIPS